MDATRQCANHSPLLPCRYQRLAAVSVAVVGGAHCQLPRAIIRRDADAPQLAISYPVLPPAQPFSRIGATIDAARSANARTSPAVLTSAEAAIRDAIMSLPEAPPTHGATPCEGDLSYHNRVGCKGTIDLDVCADMNGVHSACSRVFEGFAVCEGHGRIKHNMRTDEPRPMDVLINLVIDVPDEHI